MVQMFDLLFVDHNCAMGKQILTNKKLMKLLLPMASKLLPNVRKIIDID